MELKFSTDIFVKMSIEAVMAFVMAIVPLIVWKKKNKSVHISSYFIGCATFFLFAMVLEQALHMVVLPKIKDTVFPYAIYGALAAGIFEETGRFTAYKLFFKKRRDPKESIMYGLGHGGFEAAFIAGVSTISMLSILAMVNSMGFEAAVAQMSQGNAETEAAMREQLPAYAELTWGNVFIPLFERAIAMTYHTAASVLVFEAAQYKKPVMYPLAILIHAISDFPAALYQKQLLSMGLLYVLFGAGVALTVILAVRSYKRMKKAYREQTAEPVYFAE